ncbi:hypothetical protein G7Y89_g6805 [Cudoniella acicularis]|uniref:Uncharacterized protein n=1 Tax=Cudoniella acicularis TaxID=354080 RepID=A0A8H4RLK5_9HELO|nr:hypothetical protein G7Y89_g6805 [Cudoniella acicularis]
MSNEIDPRFVPVIYATEFKMVSWWYYDYIDRHTFLYELPDRDLELSQKVFHEAPPTFSISGKLPLELQRLIWKAAFPSRRKFFLELDNGPLPGEMNLDWRKLKGASNPIALQIRRQSREVH